ncbi:MAG: hypothetical protein GY940_45385 [bacterium]|nr:hypothetical protein [bacterium]
MSALQVLVDREPWQWPGNAGELIAGVLVDKNAPEPDRFLAVQMAGNEIVMDDDMAGLLIDILRDPGESEDMRCYAAISMGPALEFGDTMEFDDPDDFFLTEEAFDNVRENLLDIYRDTGISKTLKRRVLEASVRAPMDWHEKAIEDAYSSDDPEWKLTAVFCMGHVKGFNDRIIESLDNTNPDILTEAICAAGNWEIKEAWPTIKEIFTTKGVDESLLITAIDASAFVNTVEASEFLNEFCLSDNEDIADAAEEALAMSGFESNITYDDDDEF